MSNYSPILDMNVFNTFSELMGNKLSLILAKHIETADIYIKTMGDSFEKNDHSSISAAAHTLKSSSMQLGAARVGNIANEIEQLTKTVPPDSKKLKDLIEQINNAHEETKTVLLDKDNGKL